MAENNKISIDIKINTDGQGQISQYVHAFDDLRKSINNLSQPTSDFSKSVNELDKNLSKYADSLNKLKEQQQDAGDSGEKVANKLSTLSNVFATMSTLLTEMGYTVKGWVAGLTGGLSVVIALLPEIIKLATAIFKGKDAINAMVENLKNLNEVMKSANKDAADQSTRLQILYKSATDLNNAYSDRVKSAQELKREYPSYFKNLSDEDILTKKAKANYDELSKSVIKNVKVFIDLILTVILFVSHKTDHYIYQ